MPFSSSLFLHAFLPLFFVVYAITPRAYKNWTALVFSCMFYAWGAPRFLPIVLGLGYVDYYLGKAIAASVGAGKQVRAKRLLGFGVVLHLAILAYFKYSNFFVLQLNEILALLHIGPQKWTEVILPIGISFITFEEISYLIDVYRKDALPSRKVSHYLLFLSSFRTRSRVRSFAGRTWRSSSGSETTRGCWSAKASSVSHWG